MIHRPLEPSAAHIWLSYSSDMLHWDRHHVMLQARQGGWWDANKVGLSSPVIETSEGWLMILSWRPRHRRRIDRPLGLALFELNHPERCLLRGDEWVFAPEEEYERQGDVDNVVFPCGQTIGDDGDTILSTTAPPTAASPSPLPAYNRCSAGCIAMENYPTRSSSVSSDASRVGRGIWPSKPSMPTDRLKNCCTEPVLRCMACTG